MLISGNRREPEPEGGARPPAQRRLSRRLGLGRASATRPSQDPASSGVDGRKDATGPLDGRGPVDGNGLVDGNGPVGGNGPVDGSGPADGSREHASVRAGSGAPGDAAPELAAAAPPSAAVWSGLERVLAGPLFLPGDSGFDEECAGHNRAIRHRPALVAGATGPADVMKAVEAATEHGLPVGVMCTGHGPSVPADGALLISTKRMQGVRVDPFARVASVEAGVRWERVIHEAAPFGLAPASGSSPQVGAVGYTLGGGLPLLGRSLGYAADHVRSIDVVTAHGTLRQATADQYTDLFWALRGGQGNFGVVTSMQIELFPVATIYGGGLYFRGSDAPQVLNAYRRWLRSVPDEMSSSIALTRYPWHYGAAGDLRGRFVAHVRIAFAGSAADGEWLIRPLREAARTLRDTVAERPYSAAGGIHADPEQPFAYYERTGCLAGFDEDAADMLCDLVGPDASCPLELAELRHLGGALARPARVPNAVGNREAAFLLYVVGTADPASRDQVTGVTEYADMILERMAPWSTGRASLNFLGLEQPGTAAAPEAETGTARSAFGAEDYRRLAAVKRGYDPENMFRICHNIPPGP